MMATSFGLKQLSTEQLEAKNLTKMTKYLINRKKKRKNILV